MRIIPGVVVLVMAIGIGASGDVEAMVPPQLTAGANTPIQLTTESPRSAQEIYSEIGKLTGVTVHIDPRVKDSIISVEISAHPTQVDGEAIATVEAVIEFKPDGTLTASTEIAEGETWLIPWPHPNRTLDLALAVTAVNIEPPQFNPADLEPYWVGTEYRIAVPRP